MSRARIRKASAIIASLAISAAVAAPAHADFGIAGFDGEVLKQDGTAASQAGSHPYSASTTITLNAHLQQINPPPADPNLLPDGDLKDLHVGLPPGFVGDPTATPTRCVIADLVQHLCPVSSQVGVVEIRTWAVTSPGANNLVTAVYNMAAPPNAPGQFGFAIEHVPILLTPSLRSSGDYGLTVSLINASQAVPFTRSTLTFWGVPADTSHDVQRCLTPDLSVDPPACTGLPGDPISGPNSAGVGPTPFLRNPTSCTATDVGLETTLAADSWQHPGAFALSTFFSHLPAPDESTQIGPTGCDVVPFDPSLSARPGLARASAPSGWAFDVRLPQNENPIGLAEADLKKAVVQLPAGVRVSPSSADGLAGCSKGQIALHSTADPICPDASKIGTVTIETPLLDQPLAGAVYLASPHDNPFTSLLALYLVVKGPGLIVKLPGQIEPDPVTGQLTATFDDNPQLPFSDLHLQFMDGSRSPLVNPATCGTYTTHAQLTSWSGKTVETKDSFSVDKANRGGACTPLSFAPGFDAGTRAPIAGRRTSFSLRLSRSDEDQQLQALTVKMPRGVLGKIASVPLCSNAAANAGTCSDASKLGSVTVGAGAGSNPLYITNGRVYLTGPYKGAPFGLSIVVPAVAGPFDLGNVVVRSAIFVDRHSAALKVISDPLPSILQGIVLDVRDVRVAIDRPRFIVNPTSCAPKRVTAMVTPVQGKVANVSTHFQVAGCDRLRLAPKLTLRVGGRGHTGRGSSTALTTTLTQSPGQENLKAVSVSLPSTLNARLDIVDRACTQAEFDAGHCAARAGTAVAVTPLLAHALRGGVYFVKTAKKGALPNLVVALRGQVDFDLVGKITIPGGTRLATKFATVPDVPIKRFTLRLVAGANGPVGAAENLCSARSRSATATIGFRGQNGDLKRVDQRLQIAGCGRR